MTHMEKPTEKEHIPTPDEIIEQYGLDKPPARPVPVQRPELNPHHGPEHTMPKEHMVPLEEALEKLEQK